MLLCECDGRDHGFYPSKTVVFPNSKPWYHRIEIRREQFRADYILKEFIKPRIHVSYFDLSFPSYWLVVRQHISIAANRYLREIFISQCHFRLPLLLGLQNPITLHMWLADNFLNGVWVVESIMWSEDMKLNPVCSKSFFFFRKELTPIRSLAESSRRVWLKQWSWNMQSERFQMLIVSYSDLRIDRMHAARNYLHWHTTFNALINTSVFMIIAIRHAYTNALLWGHLPLN